MPSTNALSAPFEAANLQTIADRAGVSKSTAYRALRGLPRVSAKTVDRVCAIAAELGYDPTYQAAASRLALRKQGRDVRNQVIALVAPPVYYQTKALAEYMHGVMAVLNEHGCACLLTPVQYLSPNLPNAINLPPVLRRGEVDGVIGVGQIHLEPLIDMLRNTPGFGKRPVVTANYPMPACSMVTSQTDEGMYQITRHLLALGHRHFLHSCDQHHQWSYKRACYTGFTRALYEFGLDPEQHAHYFPVPQEWTTPHYALDLYGLDAVMPPVVREDHPLLLALTRHPKVTSYIASADAWAVRAWYVLQQVGWRIPEEISIVGYGDTDPMPGPNGGNMLTTVAEDRITLGREAAHLLLDRINAVFTEAREVAVPTKLAIRASTAPPCERSRHDGAV